MRDSKQLHVEEETKFSDRVLETLRGGRVVQGLSGGASSRIDNGLVGTR